MSAAAIVGVAALLGTGTWLVLDRDLVRTTLGAVLLGHGVVLLLVGTRPGGAAPVIASDGTLPGGGVVGGGAADPIPQALALTAIVISFGVTAFLLALAERARRDALEAAERASGAADAPVEGESPAGLGDGGEMDDEGQEAAVAREEAAKDAQGGTT